MTRRLSDMVIEKVQLSMAKLPILSVEREALDYEVTPTVTPSPAGDGLITAMYVSLCAPTAAGMDDHVTFGVIIWDPYLPQAHYDLAMVGLLEDIHKAQEEARQALPAEVRGQALPQSSSGLYIPGR